MSIAQATAAVVRANASALVLCPAEDLTPSQNLLLVLAHAFGLFALARYFHVPLLIGVALAVAFLLAGILAQRAAGLTAAWLAPLFAVYGLLVVRYVYIRVLGQSVSGYFDYALPDWTLPFLYVDFALFAACFYAVAMLASALVHSRSRVLTRAATVILATSSAWAAFAYLSGRSHGATGSDPYAYVQMGVDLATRGTPAHLFELFAQGKDLSLSWYPLLHVGYRLPFDNAGSAITVWPPGGAAAFAIAAVSEVDATTVCPYRDTGVAIKTAISRDNDAAKMANAFFGLDGFFMGVRPPFKIYTECNNSRCNKDNHGAGRDVHSERQREPSQARNKTEDG